MTVYPVKPESVPATTGLLTTAEVHAILTRLDPVALQDAGAAHTQLGRELTAVAAHLAQEAGTLAYHWSGPAARAALAQFQRLHEQAAALATQATRTGTVLTWLGTQVLPAFQHPADPAQAHQYLTQLTTDLIQADTALPAHIGTPASAGPAASTGVTAGTTRVTRPTTTVSSLQSATPAPVPGSPAASPAPNSMPFTASASSAAPRPMTLASTTLGTPISSGAPATTSEAVTTTSATSDSAAQPASVTSAAAASAETEESSNDKDSEQAPTAQTASASSLAGTPLPAHTTAAVTTPGNGLFLPGTAGVTTPPTQERHRASWAPEDRNLWGLPAACVPPLIEGA